MFAHFFIYLTLIVLFNLVSCNSKLKDRVEGTAETPKSGSNASIEDHDKRKIVEQFMREIQSNNLDVARALLWQPNYPKSDIPKTKTPRNGIAIDGKTPDWPGYLKDRRIFLKRILAERENGDLGFVDVILGDELVKNYSQTATIKLKRSDNAWRISDIEFVFKETTDPPTEL